MELDKNYSTVTTRDCVELHFKETFSNEKEKKESERSHVLYFPNLKMALKKYINNKVSDCEEFEEVFDMINHLEAKIDNLPL